MSIMLKLCNFGTIYLWIFVLRVIQVCADPRMDDGGGGVEGGGGGGGGDGEDVDADKRLNSLIKPYPYQMFHYMDDLLRRYHQENGLRPIPAKVEQHPAHQPLGAIENLPWKSGSEFEIDLKNLNDFDIYKMANAIWPIRKFRQEDREWQQKVPSKQQQQQQLRHRFPLSALLSAPTNILYTASNDGDDKGNRRNQQNSNNNKAIKTSWLKALGSNGDDDDDNDDDYTNDPLKRINDIAAKGYGKVSMQVFPPLTVDNTSNMKRTNAMNSNPDPENGNENFNYSNNDDTVSDNYPEDANLNADKNGNVKPSVDASSAPRKRGGRTRDKKPKQNLTTPFLPAISGGSMVNLGKFFRDLSKNVQFSEKYQWSSEEQKLLEGDPTFGDLHHHLHDPEGNTDQAAEWIKAIRFYRPSQKIRSLVEMNPHGQWAHGSNFIDPNYMWIGLGK